MSCRLDGCSGSNEGIRPIWKRMMMKVTTRSSEQMAIKIVDDFLVVRLNLNPCRRWVEVVVGSKLERPSSPGSPPSAMDSYDRRRPKLEGDFFNSESSSEYSSASDLIDFVDLKPLNDILAIKRRDLRAI